MTSEPASNIRVDPFGFRRAVFQEEWQQLIDGTPGALGDRLIQERDEWFALGAQCGYFQPLNPNTEAPIEANRFDWQLTLSREQLNSQLAYLLLIMAASDEQFISEITFAELCIKHIMAAADLADAGLSDADLDRLDWLFFEDDEVDTDEASGLDATPAQWRTGPLDLTDTLVTAREPQVQALRQQLHAHFEQHADSLLLNMGSAMSDQVSPTV